MNFLDLAILLPILLFAFQGYRNGVVREILTIAGIIFAVFIAFQFMGDLAEILIPLFDQPDDIMILISGIIMFSAVFILVMAIAFLTRRFLEFIKLNTLNRIFGFIFGGLKSGIAISALLLLLAGFGLPGEETRNQSITYSYVIHLAPKAFNMIASIYPGSGDFVNKIEETLDESNPIKHLSIFK